MSASIIRHVMIGGRVQGVGFRARAEHEARKLSLEGWVRNRRNGSVEAVFAGPEESVAGMMEACRRGPPGARVDATEEREGSADELAQRPQSESFSVLPTV